MARNIYGGRDIMELDEIGGHYSRHISAMTKEGLHSKSDIASELAHRDHLITRLTTGLKWALSEVGMEPHEWSCDEQADAHNAALAAIEESKGVVDGN